MASIPGITLEHFGDEERATLWSALQFLVKHDHQADIKEEYRETGFTLWVKVPVKPKPGVSAMANFASTFTDSPLLLTQVLCKLFGVNAAELAEKGSGA